MLCCLWSLDTLANEAWRRRRAFKATFEAVTLLPLGSEKQRRLKRPLTLPPKNGSLLLICNSKHYIYSKT